MSIFLGKRIGSSRLIWNIAFAFGRYILCMVNDADDEGFVLGAQRNVRHGQCKYHTKGRIKQVWFP